MPTLQEQIEARKKEARDKKIMEIAAFILRYAPHLVGMGEMIIKSFALGGAAPGGPSGTEIQIGYKGQTVFRASSKGYPSPDVLAYSPGEWELVLTELHKQASNSEKRKEDEKNQEAEKARLENEEKKKWGL